MQTARLFFVGFLLWILCGWISSVRAQNLQEAFRKERHFNPERFTFVAAAAGVAYAGALVGLNELWYADFPRSKFHFFDDSQAWLQMDKAGHAFSAYHLGYMGYEGLKWSGVDEKSALWFGGGFGLIFLTSVEVLDGFSKEWGFSNTDMAANAFGTALFVSQQALFQKQIVELKFSAWPSEMAQYRPEIFGYSVVERILKDYNSQTIWLSVNLKSFMNEQAAFPEWLNLAFGYSANNMLGGIGAPEYNVAGERLPQLERYRQYIVSVDIDLYKIQTRSPFLNTLIHTFGFLKIPAPALEFSQGGLKGHWLYY